MNWRPHLMNTFSFLVLFIYFLFGMTFTGYAANKEDYREYLAFHVGRATYVAGEPIFYKVYCYSDNKEDVFFSKVLYVELIDNQKNSISAQVLKIEQNAASSVLQLPDTLSTGLYYLKAYTQWMKNSGESFFGSFPVYIFNQYDETLNTKSNYNVSFEPEVYIQGGKLITGLPVQLQVRVPGLLGKKEEISLLEITGGNIVQSAVTSDEGYAELNFTPYMGKIYRLIMGDSIREYAEYNLPPVEYSGYSLQVNISQKGELTVIADGSNIPPSQLQLKLISGNNTVWEKIISKDFFKKELNTQRIPAGGYYHFQLTDAQNKLLVDQAFLLSPDNMILLAENRYSTRQKVDVSLDLSSLLFQEGSAFSVSIHKKYPDKKPDTKKDSINLPQKPGKPVNQQLQIFYPRNYPETKTSFYGPIEYPAEDMGMLFSGRVTSSLENSGLKGFQLILAIKDTTGLIVAATTDSTHRFSILLNEMGNKEANIFLYLGDMLLKGDNIEIDNKFFYQSAEPVTQNEMVQVYDSLFVAEMKNEAQRVLIQRAFNNNGLKPLQNSGITMNRAEPFYGIPEIVVNPGEYFLLPNFEEIAREILPRVRYKYTRDKCEITIYHVEAGNRSSNPIVLVDGIYITDYRELYELNSDDIQRIEIQSGQRIAGQLFYDGLLAVYTTGKYRAEKEKNNGSKVYSVPGYVNNNDEYGKNYVNRSDHTLTPDFANQLYWNPQLKPDQNGKASVSFYTSDEEGDYIIDITGYTPEGIRVNQKQYFKVSVQ